MLEFAIAAMIAFALSVATMGRMVPTASNAHDGTVYGNISIVIVDIETLYIGTRESTNGCGRPEYRKWSLFALIHPHPL